MPEYKLNLTEDDVEESRKRTMKEISEFIREMDGRRLAVVSLDTDQSRQWDEDGDIDYQHAYGRQIVDQVSQDGETETVVIRDCNGMPVALAAKSISGAWQGIGIDKRLRLEIATMMMNDESDFH